MFRATRTLSHHFLGPTSSRLTTPRRFPTSSPLPPQSPSSSSSHHFLYRRQLHSRPGNFPHRRTAAPLPPRVSLSPRRLAVDPFTVVILLAISSSVAYFVAQLQDQQHSRDHPATTADGHDDTGDWKATAAPRALLTMAPSMPPGRPGNLTAEQEAKLKEMWISTLELFGVAHEAAEANGGSVAATEATPEAAKTRKSRLAFLGKKDVAIKTPDPTTESGVDNDKHGQTKEFQQALAQMSPEQLRDTFWSMSKHDHPDALLLRFLRARKWDVHAALVMMVSTMHWRSEDMHVDDDIMIQGEEAALKETKSGDAGAKKEGEDFLAQLRLGKSFLHGLDKDGRPCCYVRVRLHRQGEQSEKSLERFTVYTIETTRMMLRPPVDTATIVFDMTDFSMANMDYTPVKFMIKCFEANYPESLGSVIVYRSPWIFRGIWKIIHGWLDPVVASKVHFASDVDELQEWIPRSQIMKELGGDEDYTYSYAEPIEGENPLLETEPSNSSSSSNSSEKIRAERTELVKSYETETVAWAHGKDEGAGRNRLAERLAENYWRLDPYVRARSLYDRTGVIGEGGKLNFYPKGQTSGGSSSVNGGGGAAAAATAATAEDDELD